MKPVKGATVTFSQNQGKKSRSLVTDADGAVAVPDGFFKVVLSLRKGAEKAIGFYYENNSVKQPMEQTAMSVDDVETLTGMDFFPALDDDLENRLEATFKLKEWR